MMDHRLREELLALVAEDRRLRQELAEDGSLFSEGYHPRMEAVHEYNALRLKEIIRKHGWPGKSIAGEDGAEAAWRIVQHAIGDPELQRNSLLLIKDAVARQEASAWQAAMLEDRIRTFEGREQIYGTQFDWNEKGEMAPLPIEDPEHVDHRRAVVGLQPLKDILDRHRDLKEAPPADYAKRIAEFEDWARRKGWRK